MKKGLDDIRLPSNLTIEDLTRELKREHIILNNKNIVKVGNHYQVDAIDQANLSQTEQAFHLAYHPYNTILSDNEAQVWKVSQPTLKLVTPKDQKNGGSTNSTTASQYMYDGKIVTQPIMSTQPTTTTFRGNPIILSPNLVEKFCKCQKTYEGELMIKCSNDHCQIVWYHPGCVGLGNTNPKALEEIQFTCEDCRENEKNAKKGVAQAAADKPTRKKVTKN